MSYTIDRKQPTARPLADYTHEELYDAAVRLGITFRLIRGTTPFGPFEMLETGSPIEMNYDRDLLHRCGAVDAEMRRRGAEFTEFAKARVRAAGG
jgi:hypothetical protein